MKSWMLFSPALIVFMMLSKYLNPFFQMQEDLPPQSKEGHRKSDAEEADRKYAGGEKEKGVLSSGIFSSKSQRKTANPAHQSLKKFFKSKSR